MDMDPQNKPTAPNNGDATGPSWANIPANPTPSPTQPVTPPAGPVDPLTGPIPSPLADLTVTPSTPPPEPPNTPSALARLAAGFSTVFGAVFSWVVFPIAMVFILHYFVFQAYHVLGTSMVPTLHETDYLIISKLGYTQAMIGRAFGQNTPYIPKRGQVVVFRYPDEPSKIFVKRVIGLPGDRILIKGGKTTVFNKEHPEGFDPDTKYEVPDTTTLSNTPSGILEETVPAGQIFVLGDNRTPGGSFDSRQWGNLPSSYIIGNAVIRLLPLDQIRIL